MLYYACSYRHLSTRLNTNHVNNNNNKNINNDVDYTNNSININMNKHKLGGISTNILNKNTVKTWESLDKWIEQGNEICTNSLSIVMMRTQNVRQHDHIKKDISVGKDRDREKDKEKERVEYYEERSRERGGIDDSTDEYLSSNKNEFQINDNIISDDNKRKNKNHYGNLIENEISEEEIMKNSENMSNYFRITEHELENLCTKITTFNMNSDSVSTAGERVRAHDERGILLKSCVFDAELSDLVEAILIDKDKDVYVVGTGEEYFSLFLFHFS